MTQRTLPGVLVPCFCYVLFYFILFSMAVSRLRRLFHVCDVFLISFRFILVPQSRIFQKVFFSVRSSSSRRVRFSVR